MLAGGDRVFADGKGTEAKFSYLHGGSMIVASGGPLSHAACDEPTGIAVAPTGDVFVLEPNVPRVLKISAGRVITIHNGLP